MPAKKNHSTEDISQSLSYALRVELKFFCGSYRLTPRESEVVAVLIEGVVRIKDIAIRLGLSPNTINNHVNSIFMKTRTTSKSQLLTLFLGEISENLRWARYFGRSPRALLIGSDAIFPPTLASSFEKKGFLLKRIDSQGDCFKVISEFAPHFVIAHSSGISGDTTAFLRRICENSVTQTVLIGSDFNAEDFSHAMNAGAIDCLATPIDDAKLLRVLVSHYIEEGADRLSFLEHQKLVPEYSLQARASTELSAGKLGRGGAFLSSDDLSQLFENPVEVGDWVELKFSLEPQASRVFIAQGEVVWKRDDGEPSPKRPHGAGVRFVKVGEDGKPNCREWFSDLDLFFKKNSVKSYIPSGVGDE
jgi:DNA-binding CsgD family transcriptional regulator/ActR/RegA family two-component response regulator